MELFAADGHDAGGCERVTGKSGMRPVAVPQRRSRELRRGRQRPGDVRGNRPLPVDRVQGKRARDGVDRGRLRGRGAAAQSGSGNTGRDRAVDGDGRRRRPRPDPRRRRRLRPRVQGGLPVGRNQDGREQRTGRTPQRNERGRQPAANRARGIAQHAGRRAHGAHAERRGRHPSGRRGRRDGNRHGRRRRARLRRRGDRTVGRREGAHPRRAPGRGLRRARRLDLGQLQPDAVHPAGVHRTRLARLGRRCHERRRSAVGPGEHGRH